MEPGLLLSAARWSGSWDRSGLLDLGDGTWAADTDLGYRVRLSQGFFVNYSAGFGLCENAALKAGAAFLDAVPGSAPSYLVAHTEADNPSLIQTHFIEDLVHPADIEFGEISFPAARYCYAHWLVARGEEGVGSPEGLDMIGFSFRLSGTFARNGITKDFSVDTFWPSAKLDEIDTIVDERIRIQLQQNQVVAYAFVNVTRPLARLFDGIDFESASKDQITGKIVDQLTALSVWTIDVWAPGL